MAEGKFVLYIRKAIVNPLLGRKQCVRTPDHASRLARSNRLNFCCSLGRRADPPGQCRCQEVTNQGGYRQKVQGR